MGKISIVHFQLYIFHYTEGVKFWQIIQIFAPSIPSIIKPAWYQFDDHAGFHK